MILCILDAMIDVSIYDAWDAGPYRKETRSSLSRTSLVCQRWCSSLRPKIFNHLRLSSAADVRFLLGMLGGEKSEWLSTAVTTIELVDDGTGRVDFERSCKLLAASGKLPSLAGLGLNVLPLQTTRIQPLITTLPSKVIISSFTNTRTFSVLGVNFPSFSALARVLGELPQLVQLAFHRVGWVREDIDDRPLTLTTSSFSHLRLIIADEVVAWPLMHLWAPKLKRMGSAILGGGNVDVELLSSLVKICCDSSSTTRMIMKYDPGVFMSRIASGNVNLMHGI